ncbi:MAG: GGDEF domain-containing protein [Betaproteobacteria bacterium]
MQQSASSGASTPASDLTDRLAIELFQRTRASAIVGVLGLWIMLHPHVEATPWQRYLPWLLLMLAVFGSRIYFATRVLRAPATGVAARRRVNIETIMFGLTGLGWGSALYVFDSGSMDQPFYLRFMILAAAIAFVMSTGTVFVRVFLAYTLSIIAVVVIFIISNDYVAPREALLSCTLLYAVLMVAVALGNSRGIREAAADNLAVLRLTEELNAKLETERELRNVMSKLARTDDLTGVFNRRSILEHLGIDMARSKRHGAPLAVLMIDIDHFKAINDTYGHVVGDLALRTVVQSLQGALRDTDVLGRFGGEEFLVILPVLGGESAGVAAERLREAVEKNVVNLEGKQVSITISIGVACYRPEDNAESLLARADAALYAAKYRGRNRIELEAPAQPLAMPAAALD